MSSSHVLVLTVLLPSIGAAALWLLAPLGRSATRGVALAVALATFFLAASLVIGFPAEGSAGFASFEVPWLEASTGLEISFSLSLDGLSLWLFALSPLLLITSILVSWEAIKDRAPLFYAMLLLLETGCLGVFAARDVIVFYVFFEFTLIPLFFLIGLWGSEDRRYAAMKFFIFTLAGSVLTFLGLLVIVLWNAQASPSGAVTFSIEALTAAAADGGNMPIAWQCWVFLALFAGFAIKVPLFPFHTWLPLAHVQAPTAGSVFLAGILLKIGGYGFVRFSIPLLPDATVLFLPWLLWLSVIGILYGAFVALAQTDIKRLIAYSSVSHLGFCMLGIFSLTALGVQGGTLQLVNHGVSTGALFALVGMLYERYHTREIAVFGGLARKLPVLAFFMVFFTLSSIGLPGMNGFAGEFLLLAGVFQGAWTTTSPFAAQYLVIAVLAVFGVVLGAWYMLWLVQRVFFGPLREPPGHDASPRDLSLREICALAPLAVFVIWVGLQPSFFLKRMAPTLTESTAAAIRINQQMTANAPVAPESPQEMLTRAD